MFGNLNVLVCLIVACCARRIQTTDERPKRREVARGRKLARNVRNAPNRLWFPDLHSLANSLSSKQPSYTCSGCSLRRLAKLILALDVEAAFIPSASLTPFSIGHVRTTCKNALGLPAMCQTEPLQSGSNIFLFPPVGLQHINMGRALYERNELFEAMMKQCDDLAALPRSLLDVLYPKSDEAAECAELLQTPMYTMPALFAVEYSLYRLLVAQGCVPDVVVGHSIGEFVAAVAAGVLDVETAMALVCERARAMEATMPLPSPGSMYALKASVSTAEAAIQAAGVSGTIVVAAINGPESIVVAGENAALKSMLDALPDGTKMTRVRATHADHSPLMAPVAEALAAKAAELYRMRPPSSPTCIWASTVGTSPEVITAEHVRAPEFTSYWAEHATSVVDYTGAVEGVLRERQAALGEQQASPLHFVEMGEGMLVRFCRGIPSVADAMGRGEVVALSAIPRAKAEEDWESQVRFTEETIHRLAKARSGKS